MGVQTHIKQVRCKCYGIGYCCNHSQGLDLCISDGHVPSRSNLGRWRKIQNCKGLLLCVVSNLEIWDQKMCLMLMTLCSPHSLSLANPTMTVLFNVWVTPCHSIIKENCLELCSCGLGEEVTSKTDETEFKTQHKGGVLVHWNLLLLRRLESITSRIWKNTSKY